MADNIKINESKHAMQLDTQTGPYRIDTLLGRGGMAEVYRVWHTGLQRWEAMKIISPQMSYQHSFVERFLHEARIAAGLHHPNIATIHAVSEPENDHPYFTMELVEGGDLADMLAAHGRFSLEEVLPMLRQIAGALDYSHQHGVIHRDIKPANILLCENGELKVVDFGIARAQEESGGTRLTQAGMIVGTPEYMSPEQAGSGAEVGRFTDIYSLGIIVYEMLCGKPPFCMKSGAGPISVVMAQISETPQPPREYVPGLPLHVNNAILKALAKNPANRFDSCTSFINAIDHTSIDAISASNLRSSAIYRPNSSGMPRLVTGAVLVIALAGSLMVGSALYMQKQTPIPSIESGGGAITKINSNNSFPIPVKKVNVPDVSGMNQGQALTMLKQNNLVADIRHINSRTILKGCVIQQSPDAGTLVEVGSYINITISDGPNNGVHSPASSNISSIEKAASNTYIKLNPASLLHEYITAINRHDTSSAYAMYDINWQKEYSYAFFRDKCIGPIQSFELLNEYPAVYVADVAIIKCSWRTTTLNHPAGIIHDGSFRFKMENGEWKIQTIRDGG